MNHDSILIVEDEKDILNLISYNLEREGYRTYRAETGEAGLRLAKEQQPDLVVLDLMLPGLNGIEICKRMKADQNLQETPILMLTAKTQDADVVTGLDAGADDYVTKPFSPKVLTARIRALLRRTRGADHDQGVGQLSLHGIEIDIARHVVMCEGAPVALSVTEFRILAFLARNPGWVFSRSQIITAVKGEDYPVTDRSVDVQILGLRKKLGRFGEYIRTVRGVGYKMQEIE